jgi:hypothetical protein
MREETKKNILGLSGFLWVDGSKPISNMLTGTELAMMFFRQCAIFDTSLDIRMYIKWYLIIENDNNLC